MSLMRWWCAVTTHKWRRERQSGTDLLICRRCGHITSLHDESRAARGRERRYGSGGSVF